MEAVYGVIPELRLYTQLTQQTVVGERCLVGRRTTGLDQIRHRNWRMALEVCSSMVSRHLRNLRPDQPQPAIPKGTASTREISGPLHRSGKWAFVRQPRA